jgi:hypothetical protein
MKNLKMYNETKSTNGTLRLSLRKVCDYKTENNTNKALTTKVTKFHEGKLEFVKGLLQLVRYTQPLRHLHRVFGFFVCHGSGAFEFVPGERLAGNSAQKCFE